MYTNAKNVFYKCPRTKEKQGVEEMLKYIAKRIGLALITIFTVATLTFFLMNMVPGGPFLSEKAVSPAAQAALEAKYGLDKPLSQQYLTICPMHCTVISERV